MPAATIIDSQGLALRLWDYGGQGQSVLFVHGYLDTGRSFDTVAELLGDLHCAALDWRGHGQSERVDKGGSYHLLDNVKDLAVVLDMLEKRGRRVDLLAAHSMGGNIAFLLAGAVPRLIDRLLLIDACGSPAESPVEVPERLATVVESVLLPKKPFSSMGSLQDAVDRLRATNAGLSQMGAERMVRDVLVPEGDRWAFPFDPKLRGPTPVRWPEESWLALAERMHMPVHVLRASDGYVADDQTTAARVAAMPRGALTTVTGPHHLHVETPELVAAAVRELLALPVR